MTKEERLLRQEQLELARAIAAAAREAGRGRLDLPYLLLVLTLVGVGLIMLFSASFPSAYYEEGNPAYYLIRQGILRSSVSRRCLLSARSITSAIARWRRCC